VIKVYVQLYGSDGQYRQADLLKLTFASEKSLDNMSIEDWFDPDFFETNYWYLWTSMFAFQRWSSVAAMRRYMKRFIHLLEGMPVLGGIFVPSIAGNDRLETIRRCICQ